MVFVPEHIYQTWLNLRYTYFALNSEIKKLLKTLRKNYYIGLITNGPSASQWEKIERLNLKPLFDLILVSGDLPWEKPHKKIFLEACDAFSVHPQHCIMVGDKLETDILGGIKSKLGGTVWVPLGNETLKEGDPVPDFTVQSVMDLPKIISDVTNVYSTTEMSNVLTSDLEDSNSNGSDGS